MDRQGSPPETTALQLFLPLTCDVPVAPKPAWTQEQGEWTNKEIVLAHGYLLEHSLHDLCDGRASQNTKDEILEWLNEPLVANVVMPRGFSFQMCCNLYGVHAAQLREQVLDLYKRHKVAA